MASVVVIGEEHLVSGYALAGAVVLVAETPDDVRAAWQRVPPQAAVVIVTADAAAADPDRVETAWPMVAVMA